MKVLMSLQLILRSLCLRIAGFLPMRKHLIISMSFQKMFKYNKPVSGKIKIPAKLRTTRKWSRQVIGLIAPLIREQFVTSLKLLERYAMKLAWSLRLIPKLRLITSQWFRCQKQPFLLKCLVLKTQSSTSGRSTSSRVTLKTVATR
jgi:hypothetical protein